MVLFPDPAVYQRPKCFFTCGTMGHVDSNQLPTKGKPWTMINNQDFVHKVDLIFPAAIYETIHQKLCEDRTQPEYFKVNMTLADVLSGEFFTEYIKRGNVLMLSEGQTTIGTLFTLREGMLTMYLDKETYERAGLVGKPFGSKGARGMKPRWIVSFNLRSDSMLHGKRGFDRLVYAAKNVLNQPMRWLFCNAGESPLEQAPLLKHFATRLTSAPGISKDLSAVQISLDIPPEILASGDREALEEVATETYEWLSLVRLRSPRIEAKDDIDPYLSRYRVPGDVEAETREEIALAKLSWQGFLSKNWLRKLLAETVVACPSDSWFSLSSSCFSTNVIGSGDEISVLRPPHAAERYLMWETRNSN